VRFDDARGNAGRLDAERDSYQFVVQVRAVFPSAVFQELLAVISSDDHDLGATMPDGMQFSNLRKCTVAGRPDSLRLAALHLTF